MSEVIDLRKLRASEIHAALETIKEQSESSMVKNFVCGIEMHDGSYRLHLAGECERNHNLVLAQAVRIFTETISRDVVKRLAEEA